MTKGHHLPNVDSALKQERLSDEVRQAFVVFVELSGQPPLSRSVGKPNRGSSPRVRERSCHHCVTAARDGPFPQARMRLYAEPLVVVLGSPSCQEPTRISNNHWFPSIPVRRSQTTFGNDSTVTIDGIVTFLRSCVRYDRRRLFTDYALGPTCIRSFDSIEPLQPSCS